jgi:cytochrome c peroxidase
MLRAWLRVSLIIVAALVLATCGSQGRYAGEPNQAYIAGTKAYVGRPSVPHPADNAPAVGKIDLGRKLFYDKRLSADGSVSCGTCHDPDQGYTRRDVAIPPGAGGSTGRRNPPSLYDVGYRRVLFHDGRAPSLEAQYLVPMVGPTEMGNKSVEEVVARIRGLPDYERFFAYAFSSAPSSDNVGKALAAYQRVLVTGPSRFDRWRNGEKDALSSREIEGFRTFERAGCGSCHTISERSAEFTDDQFHGNGYAKQRAEAAALDEGRGEITRRAQDRYAFRTPTLRNVALTPPYMHDGGLATLSDVLNFYADYGLKSVARTGSSKTTLGEEERADLLAFLQSLNSDVLP